jgi:vacuolar-type H+-ATPase subunit H
MSTVKHDKDDNDSKKAGDGDTRKIINQTFDDAKNKARKAIDETHRDLPRYMQTVTNNQEQTVNAARDIIDNYIESQRVLLIRFKVHGVLFLITIFGSRPNGLQKHTQEQ